VGPKIASFILRDLSFLSDYSNGAGRSTVVFRQSRDHRWFDGLSPDDQALYMPIDIHVHKFARKHRASMLCAKQSVQDIQWDADLHRRAGSEIVRWARAHDFDPRDLNVYWYSLGAGDIHEDGSPTE